GRLVDRTAAPGVLVGDDRVSIQQIVLRRVEVLDQRRPEPIDRMACHGDHPDAIACRSTMEHLVGEADVRHQLADAVLEHERRDGRRRQHADAPGEGVGAQFMG
ncbi:MAG: hypothetical protein ACK559_21320, partial [bacterium]